MFALTFIALCGRFSGIGTSLPTVTTVHPQAYGHSGCLWQGRFYSGAVEKPADVASAEAAGHVVSATIPFSGEAWNLGFFAVVAETRKGTNIIIR